MKIYKDFIIVKALNRDRDLGLRIIKNKLYISILLYNKRKNIYEYECNEVLIYDTDKLMTKLVDVMNNIENNIFYNDKRNKQDILMKLIYYNKAFKLNNTLKLSLYSYIGVNDTVHSSITISIDSARNLYKLLNSIKLFQNSNITKEKKCFRGE